MKKEKLMMDTTIDTMVLEERSTRGCKHLYSHANNESRNRQIVTIHKAIEDGTYHNLKHLLYGRNNHSKVQQSCYDCTLLWEPNGPAGWTACHFAASNFVPTEWWKWIMEQASEAPLYDGNQNLFLATKNALGQTVVDIFFRSYIRPLPWQSLQVKNRSRRLMSAITIVTANRILCNEVQIHYDLLLQRSQSECNGFIGQTSDENSTATLQPHYHMIERVANFLINLQILCQSIMRQQAVVDKLEAGRLKCINDDYSDKIQTNNDTNTVNFLSALCYTGTCPSIVADLLVSIFQPSYTDAEIQHADSSQSLLSSSSRPIVLPLHNWCTSQSEFGDDDGLLPALINDRLQIKRHKALALVIDPRNGNLPLLTAIQSGKSWHQVEPLFLACPSVLQDTVQDGLPIFAWAAAVVASQKSTEKNEERVMYRARQNQVGDKGLVSVWHLANPSVREKAIQEAAYEIECEQLTTIFQSLLLCPLALNNATQANS